MDNPRRSDRLEGKEQAKALEQPNQSTVTRARPSNRLAQSNDPLPKEQVVEQLPIVEPQLDLLVALPKELFYIIMNMLELWEQFTARSVCHSWKDKIEEMLSNESKECLKLNVKKYYPIENMEHDYRRVTTTWKPNESACRMQFEFAYKEPVSATSGLTTITIWDNAFNSDAAQAFGRIFNQAMTIIIYWDTDDSEANIDNLVVLLSQFDQFNVVTTFGLIVSGNLINRETLPKICTAINTHLAPLKQLHLMVPEAITSNNLQQGEMATVELYPHPVELDKAIEFATNFSIAAGVNIGSLLGSVGHKLTAVPSPIMVRPQLESLSFLFYKTGENQNRILAALDSNRDKFVSVKRLLLVNVGQRSALERLLVYFPNVEQLFLKYYTPSRETFGLEWVAALKPLTKLTELTLLHFKFERKSLGWGGHGPVDETADLNQVRKLTVASPYLFYHLRRASNPIYSAQLPLLPQLITEDIGDTVEMRYPGLQELNLWSGDWEFHQTPQSTWQTLEQRLTRQLPLSLPLQQGLRVNIQLRHPAMVNEHLNWPATAQSNYTRAVAASKVNKLSRNCIFCNQLLEQRQPPVNLLNQNRLLVEKDLRELIVDGIRPLIQAQFPVEGQIEVPEDVIQGISVLMQIPGEIVVQVAEELAHTRLMFINPNQN